MTQSNFIHTDEVPAENTDTRRMFWGTIALDILAMLVFGYFLAFLQRTDKTPIVYVGMAIFLATFLAALASLILTIRGRQKLGAEIVLYSLSVLGITMIAVFQGRTPTASLSILTISIITILSLLPRQSRRWYLSVAVVSFIMMWVIEWVDPSWRIQLAAAKIGPVAVIVFAVILAMMVVRQAWSRNNIRSRFLTFSLSLTLMATVVIAVISVYSLLSAGKQAQTTSASVLREQAQNSLVHQTVDVAETNGLILQGTSLDAENVAQQAAYIFENPNAYNPEENWKADEHMFLGGLGQYINGADDVSTVFVPNTVRVTDNFKRQLELLAFLDNAFVPVYESDPNSVAIYFVGKEDISWLYPNINLGALVPPDYLATQDIFYTIGAPENNPDRQVVWTPVYDDPGGQGLLVSAIAPVYTNGSFRGIIGIDVSLAGLTAAIEQEKLDSGGYSLLLDKDGRALALSEQGYLDFYGREREGDEFGSDFASSARPEYATLLTDMLSGSTGFESVIVDDQELYIAYTTMESTGWHIASVVSADQVLAPATALQTELGELSSSLIFQRILPVGIVFVIIAVVLGIFFTNRLVNPLEQLTEGAAKIGAGDWDTPLPQSDLIEIDGLSRTLSNMVAQLRNTLGSLEQRVADRTRNLELAAEVGRSVSQVRALDVMLKDATELILKEFNLYYVQVYLTDPAQRNLILEAGTGDVGVQLLGRGHSLPLNTGSINGRAAMEKTSVVISDTAASATFRKNPLLPETRAEMAVPLIVADKVVGVLDMQSSETGVLNEEVLPAFEALAGQLAVAIQNANLVAETEAARAEVEKQARRLVRTGWDEHMDAIHKPEHVGFMFDHNQVTPLTDMDESDLPEAGNAISASISVTGESLGSLIVEIDDESRREQTNELVNVVARQVAQQIENLRLLESAERYRSEAEKAARLQTVEGWQGYMRSRNVEQIGYLYDTNEVRLYSNGQEETNALTLPVKARDENVGKLSVRGLTSQDVEELELANVVAERLGAHIESLRLLEETKRGQVELDKRAQQLASVAAISTASSQELEVGKLLSTVVNLTQRQFGLYHTHIFTFDEATQELNIAACGWQEGDEHEGTHETVSIPLDKKQSLVARAARTKRAVIVNDVKSEPGWLANPLLPDTASEMAVPLVIGDRVLGVLDVQSDRINGFTDEDANIQTTLASQVATAMQNASSFTQAQKQAERESTLNIINQKIQSATSVEAVLQIAARELGHALGAPMTIAQLSMKDKS
ncbi:MAG TPA: GAF domain-containing protein [Anaerolineales bacterium]|nr:GAF domain-containing protein [Anaerolineales bacterium]